MSNLSRPVSILLIIILVSCKQLKISDNERKAVSEISELYGGTCTYSMNTKFSTKGGKKSFFEIEISNSDLFNENDMWTEMHASNFAYMLFTHIKNDKRKYDNIRSTIVTKDGRKDTFEYSLDTLEIVNTKMNYVVQVIDILKSKNYEKINQLLIPDVLLPTQERDKYLNYIKSADSTFGSIESFTPTGFRFSSVENGTQFLHISGNLKRSIKDTQFSIDTNPNTGKGELYLLGYDY
jgi:hypothetical protein